MTIAFDYETWLIQDGILAPPVVCGSFFDGVHSAELKLRDAALAETRAWLLTSDDMVGANVAYDFGCYLAARPQDFDLVWDAYASGRVKDVLIASTLHAIAEGRLIEGELLDKNGRRMVDPNSGKQAHRYTLALATWEWCGRKDAKANDTYRLRYAELDGLPLSAWPPEAIQYPKDDAVNTLDVWNAQLKGAKNLHEVSFQTHVAFCLHLSAMNGLRTNPERVSSLAGIIAEKGGKLRDVVVAAGLMRPTSRSKPDELSKDMKAIRERVQTAWKGQAPLTPSGAVSTAREVLEESGDNVLEALGEVSKWEKLETYLPSLQTASKVPLNVRPNVILATGRTSYDGLVQLMPRKGGVRECFEFRGIGSSVDYSAIELSTLSQVCLWTVGHSLLADAINSGKDPHSILGAALAGVPYDEFRARYKANDEATADLRQGSKAGNFGFPGGMGPVKFVQAKRKEGLSICNLFYRDGRCGEEKVLEWRERPCGSPTCKRCIEQSEELRSQWFSTWGEMRPYLAWVNAQLETKDWVEQFVSKRIRGGLHFTNAANTFFQGLAADGAKRAVVAMTAEMYGIEESPLNGSRLCIFAHDETIIDIPDRGVDFVDKAARRQAEVMVEQMRTVVPDVKVSAEPALMKFWSKEAKERKDERGRYIVWDS